MMLRDHTATAEIAALEIGISELREKTELIESTIERLVRMSDAQTIPSELLKDRDRKRADLLEMEKRKYHLEIAIKRGDIDPTIH